MMIMITQEELKQNFFLDEKGNLVRTKNAGKVSAGTFSTCKDRYGYIAIGFKGKTHRAHRLVWLYVHGEIPDSDIDHINGIRSDNRIENLRLASRSENKQNTKAQSNNKSGLKGVWKSKNSEKWLSSICIKGKSTYLGSFDSPQEAHAAYIAASKIAHTHNIF